MTCTSTSAPSAHAFNPSARLARFETEARTRTFAERLKIFHASLASVAMENRPALMAQLEQRLSRGEG